MILTCPICDDPIEVSIESEYQGDPPMGGTVYFWDIDRDCPCEWSKADEASVAEAAFDHVADDLT
jgi:hypothetical protein